MLFVVVSVSTLSFNKVMFCCMSSMLSSISSVVFRRALFARARDVVAERPLSDILSEKFLLLNHLSVTLRNHLRFLMCCLPSFLARKFENFSRDFAEIFYYVKDLSEFRNLCPVATPWATLESM